MATSAAGFRLRLGSGVALRLRSRRLSACAALFPLADRRPKPRQDEEALKVVIRGNPCSRIARRTNNSTSK